MRNRLPVHIENRELPMDQYKQGQQRDNSYGYVNILYLTSIIITVISVVTVIIARNR